MAYSPGSKSLPTIEKTVTREQIRLYARASGDLNPIHLDEEYASTSNFGKIVAHGMLTLAFLSEMLTRAYGRSWIESGGMKVRFKRPAYPGERLHTWGEVSKEEDRGGHRLVSCSIALLTSDNNEEIITGTATVCLPLDQETI